MTTAIRKRLSRLERIQAAREKQEQLAQQGVDIRLDGTELKQRILRCAFAISWARRRGEVESERHAIDELCILHDAWEANHVIKGLRG